MRSFRGTFVFAVLVGLFAGYAYFDFKKSEKETVAKSESEKVVRFEVGDLQRFQVVKPKETMIWEKKENKWLAQKPFQDEAEDEAIVPFLDSLAQEKGEELKPDTGGKPLDWAQYGLDQPGADISLKKQNGDTIRLQISKTAAFDGQYYVRVNDRLILGSSNWGRISEKTAGQLRNKKILRTFGKVRKIQIESVDKKKIEAIALEQSKSGSWQFLQHGDWAVDGEKVEKFTEELSRIRSLDFVTDTSTEQELKQHGLDHPALKLTFEFAEGAARTKPWTISLSTTKENAVFAKTSDVSAIMKLSEFEAAQLRKSSSDFRDGKIPFRIATDQAQSLEVRQHNKSSKVKRDGQDWKLTSAQAGEVADSENVKKVLDGLGRLEAKQFLAANQVKTFGSAEKELLVFDGAGKALLKLEIGQELKSDKPNGEKLTLVRSNLTAGFLAVPTQMVAELPIGGLVKSANAGESTSPGEKR